MKKKAKTASAPRPASDCDVNPGVVHGLEDDGVEMDKEILEPHESIRKVRIPKILAFQSNSAALKSTMFSADAPRQLSNFAELDVCIEGLHFPTVEHAFQGMKYTFTNKPELLHEFVTNGTVITPGEAKLAGGRRGMQERGCLLDIERWNENRVRIMTELIHSKMKRHPQIRDIVKAAQDNSVTMVHTSRSDQDWGAHLNEHKTSIKKGNNMLGDIYNSVNLSTVTS
jgi:ribA/ribD-fused uncharacterized protein